MLPLVSVKALVSRGFFGPNLTGAESSPPPSPEGKNIKLTVRPIKIKIKISLLTFPHKPKTGQRRLYFHWFMVQSNCTQLTCLKESKENAYFKINIFLSAGTLKKMSKNFTCDMFYEQIEQKWTNLNRLPIKHYFLNI